MKNQNIFEKVKSKFMKLLNKIKDFFLPFNRVAMANKISWGALLSQYNIFLDSNYSRKNTFKASMPFNLGLQAFNDVPCTPPQDKQALLLVFVKA